MRQPRRTLCPLALLGLSIVGIWLAPPTIVSADEPWRMLFDGSTLDGWVRRGGEATYTIEEGAIVGHSRKGTPNTFLCTDRNYGDFELELEFMVHPELNSGIQIRSNSLPDYKNGQVHGYQVEIDPSERAWTAGIYDEGRRGWLADLKENEAARQAFRPNEWNKVRIVCDGSSIRTWLNDVPAADLTDDLTAEGFIALQVHSTDRDEPMTIRWRNIRLRELKDE
ncbi:MAG TPA: DUF1080 domain-containing protein [Pirellulaceae bacterium]|nr:DUF1080 domain-containing protein [Pirellulaceae bacterium]